MTPGLGPTTRWYLVKRFKQLGWTGPRSGGKHQFMQKGTLKVRIPNPHSKDVGPKLLAMILKQAKISADEWNGKSKGQS